MNKKELDLAQFEGPMQGGIDVQQTRAVLLAECKRQRAELGNLSKAADVLAFMYDKRVEEIDRQREQIKALREALQRISTHPASNVPGLPMELCDIARAALAATEESA